MVWRSKKSYKCEIVAAVLIVYYPFVYYPVISSDIYGAHIKTTLYVTITIYSNILLHITYYILYYGKHSKFVLLWQRHSLLKKSSWNNSTNVIVEVCTFISAILSSNLFYSRYTIIPFIYMDSLVIVYIVCNRFFTQLACMLQLYQEFHFLVLVLAW